MKISEENKYELFDKYVSGHMSQEESLSFRSILDNDENLASELNLIKELHEVQEFSINEEKLKTTLSSIHTSKTGSGNKLKWVVLAIALALLSFVLFNTITKQSKISQDNVPMAMFEPLELTTKSNEAQSNLRLMQDLYNKKEYKKAMPYLLSHLEVNPQDLDVLLAKGIALMETGKLSEAHSVFDDIKNLKPRVHKYKYYKALTYLKEGDNAKAKDLLNTIASDNDFGHDHAAKLLKSIK